MKKQLITRIASDLNMEPYKEETESEFCSRLIYTAIVCWIRYFVIDKSNNDVDLNIKSKKYIMTRGKELLKNYLDLFPECKDYFLYKEKNNENIRLDMNEAIKTIRDRMLNAGEIIEINPNSYIGIPKYYQENIYKNVEREYGLNSEEFSSKHIGITRIKNNNYYVEEKKNIDVINPIQFLEWIIENSKWEEFNTIEKLKIFNPESKKIPSKSWDLDKVNISKDNIYLVKEEDSKRKWETQYFLLKKENGLRYAISIINSTLVEWKEYRRLILALRKNRNNSAKVQVKDADNYKILKFFVGLPLKEQILIETYCWPRNNIYNTREYIVPIEIWEYIKEILKKIYIEIEEVL